MQRSDIINTLIKKNKYKTYLEIGLDNPNKNYNLIECENKESVDPYNEEDHKNGFDEQINGNNYKLGLELVTYRMTSDEFFEQNNKTYDIIFIDGLHLKEQVAKDIINSLKILNSKGKIVVHDCLPGNEKMQQVPRKVIGWNGDVWKAIPELKKQNIEYYTVDCDYGCCVINPVRKNKKLKPITTFDNEWKDFVKNKKELLNVISEKEFNEMNA